MRKGKTAMKILATTSLGMGLVIILFLSSERQVHRNNAFTRRYPPHPIIKQYDLDINYNSYYIAGFDQNLLYLGNRSAPWHLLEVDLDTRDTSHIRLEPSTKKLEYRSLKVNVHSPYFFMMDGTMPLILRGNIGEWKAKPWMEGEAYFNKALAVDSNRIMIRAISSQTQKAALGLITKEQRFNIHLDTSILKRQIDGIMDVDGELNYCHGIGMMGYLHFYTNEFIIMDDSMTHIIRRNTIDTIKRPQIRLSKKGQEQGMQISAPPVIVNNTGALTGDLMFINTDRLGKNELNDDLEEMTIIDVYNWKKGTYVFSFSLNHSKKEIPREFEIVGDRLVVMKGNKIEIHHLVKEYFQADNHQIQHIN